MATRRSAKTRSPAEWASQPDPTAPLDWQVFLAAAAPVLATLQADLAERAKSSVAVTEALTARFAAEREQKRTGDSYVEWLEHFVEQVAAAWLLSCVFVRTLEDRGLLVGPAGSSSSSARHNRIAGPGASDSLKLFLEMAPSLTERDYLLAVFRELSRHAVTAHLFDARHNPVWVLTPSAEAARKLLGLFTAPGADAPAFRFGQSDTGFLGWLYQDLNAAVRERFALLQTPRFVEWFILDRTLEPAIAKFGLNDTTVIDPTCGSGHFLLGAFDRLYEHRLRNEPGLSPRVAAHQALDAVFGADLNPYAVAIARFRLTLSFLEKGEFTQLRGAPALPLHVVVADSLLHNPHVQQRDLGDVAPSGARWRVGDAYSLEDEAATRDVLHRTFAAVVGNPPYITVKDPVLREEYRSKYRESAAGKYSIAAPFTECFFRLARAGGRIGMITANSFMKREFGKPLIEKFLPRVNLDSVINTSGAYIPGHGTPTVLLFGSHEAPVRTTVHTVLASRGEPATPDDPEQGLVWRSIADHYDELGFENEFISVSETQRTSLEKHPWNLGGGGAAELKELLEERAEMRLRDTVTDIGFASFTGLDDAFMLPISAAKTQRIEHDLVRPMVTGEDVRDWFTRPAWGAISPYSHDKHESLALEPMARWARHLWPYRTTAKSVLSFGGKTREQSGENWWEWYRWQRDRYAAPFRITFAFVASHNHFVLDGGGAVFNRSAPIIKLPDTATEADHYALLAYLNSSTACFWMKQVFYPKGGDQMGDGGRLSATSWEDRFEFAGTGLQSLPLPPHWEMLRTFGERLDLLAKERSQLLPAVVVDHAESSAAFSEAEAQVRAIEQEMAAVQESLDWEVYRLFGLHNQPEACLVDATDVAGARAFERRHWERIAGDGPDAAWWRRGGHPTPVGAPSPTQALRISLASTGELSLLETLDFKRWWRPADWNTATKEALAKALLDHAEKALADGVLARRSVVSTLTALPHLVDLSREAEGLDVSELLEAESMPFLAALRFKDSGLERHAEWERTWELQRREDAGEKIPAIPVPPKYGQGDFRSTTYYQLRGPLDVPKERFISYPGCESDEDGEPVYGWAGWDHEQRARALATLYVNRRDQESWTTERLTPMLAGLLELLPWLKQWHSGAHDDYAGSSPATYYEGFLDEECRKHSLTREQLRAWRPLVRPRGRSPRTRSPKQAASESSSEEPHRAMAIPTEERQLVPRQRDRIFLETLKLTNYRRFDNLEITFDSDLTAIVAMNGGGKTAILDSIATAISPFIDRLRNVGKNGSQDGDVRLLLKQALMQPVTPSLIEVHARFGGQPVEWQRELSSRQGKWTTSAAVALEEQAARLEQALQRHITDDTPRPILPVFAYFRAKPGAPKKKTARQSDRKVATASYESSFDALANQADFERWFEAIVRESLNDFQSGLTSPHKPAEKVAAVRSAVDVALRDTGWSNLNWDFIDHELTVRHEEHGVLPFRQLSDGLRQILLIAADLASRAAQLNPHLGAETCRLSSGIVIIDEVDKHLHPGWQQTILPQLRDTFPLFQFIVTTHSPYVVSSIPSRCIRVLGADGEVSRPTSETEGYNGSFALGTVFGVDDEAPGEFGDALRRWRLLIEDNASETAEAKELEERLTAHFGAQHPAVLSAHSLKRLQALKARRGT